MSLSRVDALETFVRADDASQHSRRGSTSSFGASERARRLSFNPLPESWNPASLQDKETPSQAVGAFEVPQWKRILQVFVTVLYCLFAAGVVFGYAAIKPVLIDEGAYQETCQGDETCVEIHLNLMFTVAAVATNVAALPIGAILDHFGPRVCGILGALFLAVGAVIMSFAKQMTGKIDGYLLGYLFLALGGPFTYISAFQLSNAFPHRSGLILALLTGAFDASSALFLIYRIIYEKTGGSFGLHKFFLVYLIVPVAIVFCQFTILPRYSYKTVGEMIETIDNTASGPEASCAIETEDQVDEHTALLQEEEQQQRRQHRDDVAHDIEELLGSTKVDKQVRREGDKNQRSGVWGVMHGNTIVEQLLSPWFILICLFTVVQMTRINYFVATIRVQYRSLLGSKAAAAEINNFFDLALPIGGLISIPFIGVILDHTSTIVVLATLVSVSAAIGVFGTLPFEWAAYVNIVLFVLYRPFYYTAVSDYSAKVFGFRTFGTVYGTIICLSGLFNFSQSLLDYLLHETFGGDPIPVNVILLALGLVVGIALVSYVALKVRLLRKKSAAAARYNDVGGQN